MAETPKLRRSLGLFACTMMGVGAILGAGIYALVGKATGQAGGAVWISFVIAAGFAGLTGLGYAELSSFIPRAGGQYHYIRRAFGARTAFVATWLMLGGLALVSATVALGFAGYLDSITPIPTIPTAVAAIAVTAVVLTIGIRESAWFAGVCTALEVLGLVVVIVLGVPALGTVDLLEAPHGWVGIGSGAALIFFAYIGFEEIVQLSEEAHEPTRTIPRALLLSVLISTVLYVLVAMAAVSLVGWPALAASDAPLATVVAETGPRITSSIATIALFSTANTVLMMMLSAARLLYGMAEHGALPSVLGRVHPRRKTPWVATVAVATLSAGCVVGLRRIELVATVSNFVLFATFILVNAAVIALRFREPHVPRPFRIPGAVARVPLVPVVAIVGAVGLALQTSLVAAAVTVGLGAIGFGLHTLARR